MSQTITLELPDAVFAVVQQAGFRGCPTSGHGLQVKPYRMALRRFSLDLVRVGS